MTPVDEEQATLTAARASALVEEIALRYVPAKLEPSERFALERDLWARIESRRRSVFFRPVLAMVTVVATVLWFARPPTDSDTVSMAAAVVDAWEYDVLFSDALDDVSLEWATSAGLPEEYESIEALLEGDDTDERND